MLKQQKIFGVYERSTKSCVLTFGVSFLLCLMHLATVLSASWQLEQSLYQKKKKKEGEKKVNMKEAIRISHTSSCLLTLSSWSHCKALNYLGDVGNWCCNNTVYAYFHYLFIPIVHDHFKAVVILYLAWLHTLLV